MDCPQCGTGLRNDSRFCPNCGSRIKTISQARVSETVAVPAATAVEVERRPVSSPASGDDVAGGERSNSNGHSPDGNGSAQAAAGLLPTVPPPRPVPRRQPVTRPGLLQRLSRRQLGVAGGGVVLLLLAFLLLHSLGGGAAKARPPVVRYDVKIAATMPVQQRVGDNVLLTIGVRNPGRAVPNLVLRFDGLAAWVVNNVFDNCGSGSAQELTAPGSREWALGPISQGTSCQVDLTLVANQPGRHPVRVTSLAKVDAQGTGDMKSAISGGGFTRVVLIRAAGSRRR